MLTALLNSVADRPPRRIEGNQGSANSHSCDHAPLNSGSFKMAAFNIFAYHPLEYNPSLVTHENGSLFRLHTKVL